MTLKTMTWQFHRQIVIVLIGLMVTLLGCSDRTAAMTTPPEMPSLRPTPAPSTVLTPEKTTTQAAPPTIVEVSPPQLIQSLQPYLENYQPQVSIQSPAPEQVLQTDTITVQLKVSDLPVFQDATLGMGPHLEVILDNQPYIMMYDLETPLVLKDLTAGTHTLRVFASRPWHESFKNEGAYAQVTFHVFAKTQTNAPDPSLPLLTYSRPTGTYGAEPILLDFYLTNAPLHVVAREMADDDIPDWRIRATVNGQGFVFDRWQPIYLQGFQPGKNWVKLEFLNEDGEVIRNEFNTTARVITYEPGSSDSFSKLIKGELALSEARRIVDPTVPPTVKSDGQSDEAIVPSQPEKPPAKSVESPPREPSSPEVPQATPPVRSAPARSVPVAPVPVTPTPQPSSPSLVAPKEAPAPVELVPSSEPAAATSPLPDDQEEPQGEPSQPAPSQSTIANPVQPEPANDAEPVLPLGDLKSQEAVTKEGTKEDTEASSPSLDTEPALPKVLTPKVVTPETITPQPPSDIPVSTTPVAPTPPPRSEEASQKQPSPEEVTPPQELQDGLHPSSPSPLPEPPLLDSTATASDEPTQ